MSILTETSADGEGRVKYDFVELFRRDCVKMIRLAALLSADDPEDIAQEAFARIYRAWSSRASVVRPHLRTCTAPSTIRSHRQGDDALSRVVARRECRATTTRPASTSGGIPRCRRER
jgi:DNA-directed RNA polymerase specialized sigma24 family protein